LQYLDVIEIIQVANGTGWLVGDKLTTADLRAHILVSWWTGGILEGIPATCVDAFPILKAVHDKVTDHRVHGTKHANFGFVPEN
jgi:glutathione S-transferase